MKKNRTTPIIIAVLAILGLFALIYFMNPADEGNQFIKVRLYDADGNVISGSPLSIVGGIPGVSYIDLTVSVVNTGALPLSCSIVSASPTAFDSAILKTTKLVPITGDKKGSWTSNLIATASFEGSPTPDVFSATVRCSYQAGTETVFLPDQTGSINLNIGPDGAGAFIVQLNSGGIGTCGNGVCEAENGETSATCLVDCPPPVQHVKFRTSDLSYVSGSAVAYSTTCGNNLLAHGYTTTGMIGSGTCTTSMTSDGYSLVMSGLPGGWQTGYNAPSLWKYAGGDKVRVCTDKTGGNAYWRQFEATDSDASKVSTDPIATGAKEVNC